MEKINSLFWLNSSKKNIKGESPIMLRVTVDDIRANMATGYRVHKSDWDQKSQCITDESENAETFDVYRASTQIKIQQLKRDLLVSGETLTAALVIDHLKGKTTESLGILQAFQRHNDHMFPLIGKDIIKSTHDRYLVTCRKLTSFIRDTYRTTDVELSKLTVKFIADFEHYLKVKDEVGQNTTAKHLKVLKKVVRYAITNQLLQADPFCTYKCKTTKTDRGFLTAEELKTVENKDLGTDRLSIVRDLFVFCCYTGLSYVDLDKLRASHLSKDSEGGEWIVIDRSKTGTTSMIPLLPKARAILDKYANHPECRYKKRLLPIRSNQKMNEYLDEIASLCKISKRTTCHLARHTFATTVTLANGITTEVVQKMLGHKNIRTTEIYAKMTMGRIAAEMNQIKNKL